MRAESGVLPSASDGPPSSAPSDTGLGAPTPLTLHSLRQAPLAGAATPPYSQNLSLRRLGTCGSQTLPPQPPAVTRQCYALLLRAAKAVLAITWSPFAALLCSVWRSRCLPKKCAKGCNKTPAPAIREVLHARLRKRKLISKPFYGCEAQFSALRNAGSQAHQ